MAVRHFLQAALTALALFFGAPAFAADDPYLWLEDRNGERAKAWVAEENAKTLAELTSDKRYDAYVDTALAEFTASDRLPYGYVQGGFVYNFAQGAEHPQGVWQRTPIVSYKSPNPIWDTIIDFDALSAKEGRRWVFQNANCTWPYKRCLVSMSPDGGDATEVREFDMPSRSFVQGGFFSPVSKSELSWLTEDIVLLSPAYKDDQLTASGYPRSVQLWRRGAAKEDAETIFAADPTDSWTYAYAFYDSSDGLDVMLGRGLDFYRTDVSVRRSNGQVVRLPLPLDAQIQQHFQQQLVFSLRSDWTAPDGRLLKSGGLYSFDMGRWLHRGSLGRIDTLFEPEARQAILSTAQTETRLFVSLSDNVRGRVVAFERDEGAWQKFAVDLPDNGDIAINHADYGGTVSFSYTDFLTPSSIIWSDDNGKTLKTIKSASARFDASPFVSEQFEATSKDGTKVPYFVVHKKGVGEPRPTLLYGYGGFEVPMTPYYSGLRGKLWLEQGNVWALANIRGGGEFGPAWHQAAVKENRQRAYDDFAAVAEDMEMRGLTTRKQMGIVGGSNGGLLTGVMLTQRPELFGAVISEVPLLDMLRYTFLPVGASWIAEYGDPTIPEEAAYIVKYSPYQNVKPDVSYPPSLFLTSTADDRVHPGHARKMAAKMQAEGHNALFYENTEGGHTGGGDIVRQARFYASEYLFLQRELEGATPAVFASAEETSRDLPADLDKQPPRDCNAREMDPKANVPVASQTPAQRALELSRRQLCPERAAVAKPEQ